MKQKVMVGIITHEDKAYCLNRLKEFLGGLDKKLCTVMFVDNSKSIDFYNILQLLQKSFFYMKNVSVSVKRGVWRDDVGLRIVANRNYLRSVFLNSDCDYLMMLDADCIPPKGTVEKLLARKVDVVYAVCPIIKKGKVMSNIYNPEGKLMGGDIKKKFKFVKMEDLCGVVEVISVGLGCCLVSRNVMEKIEFRAKDGKVGWMISEDLMFCADLHKAGYKIFADCDIVCQHYVKGKEGQE